MEKLIKCNCLNYVILACLILFSDKNASAQYSRFTIDTKIGTTFTLGSVSTLPGANGSLALRYAASRFISFDAYIGSGVLLGNGGVIRQIPSGTDNSEQTSIEKFRFNTEFYTWGGSVYVNIQKLFIPSKKPKAIIPYLYAGIGSMRAASESENLQNFGSTIRYATYFTSNIGLEMKIKGSESMDYLLSIQQNFTQTPYLDGIPYDNKYDGFVSLSAGVSYHLSSNNKKKTSIDWTRSLCCPSFYN